MKHICLNLLLFANFNSRPQAWVAVMSSDVYSQLTVTCNLSGLDQQNRCDIGTGSMSSITSVFPFHYEYK